MNRTIVLLYGLVAYFIGVAGLAAIVVTLAGLMPWGFMLQGAECPVSPIIVNISLISVWGFIHTCMARRGFKDAVTKIIPRAAERPTYVLVAGITSIALVGFWHQVPGQIWQLQEGLAASLGPILVWVGVFACVNLRHKPF